MNLFVISRNVTNDEHDLMLCCTFVYLLVTIETSKIFYAINLGNGITKVEI